MPSSAEQSGRRSERKRAEAERNRLAEIVEHSNDAIVSRAPDGTIQSWNAAAERMFGWSAQEAIGQSITIMTPPERRGTMRPIIERVMAGELVGTIETSHRRKDGARIWTSVSLSAMKNAAGQNEFISFFYRDITAEKRAQERLNHLSHHDALTDLPNRGLFQDRLERAVAQARRRGETLGVLMVNIDRFGKVNESLGMRITAEGVEDAVQLETIRLCGCDDYQGYHFSRPLPAAQFRALLARTQAQASTLDWASEVGDLAA